MPPRVEKRSAFEDESGATLFWEFRLAPKGFRLGRPDADGKVVYNMDGARWVLYRLPEVLAAKERGDWIMLVEGPKDADTIRRLGKVGTTNAGGAAKWRPEYTETLRGAKVVIIHDNDEPGRKHALTVAAAVDPVVEKLRVYSPPPQYKDVTELIEAGGSLKDLVPFDDWRAAKPSGQQTRSAPLRVMSVEELLATPDADEHDFLLGPLMIKGSRIVIGAHSGHGKTSFGLQSLGAVLRAQDFLSWHGSGNGTRALVLDVEQGQRTVKRRFIEAGLHEIPEKIDIIHEPDGLSLDSDARQIAELEAIFANGRYDIVLADPLYKMHRGDPNDERRAVDLMRQFDAWRERFGFALVLPMHCRKPRAGEKFSIHDISGSGAFTFGAEVIVGLQRVSQGYSFLHWWKDREGDLGCMHERWGLLFDHEHGFRRDPRDLDRTPTRDLVRQSLAATPGMTIDELREATGAKQTTIRKALEDIGALDDGVRLVADRHWSLPATLFDGVAA